MLQQCLVLFCQAAFMSTKSRRTYFRHLSLISGAVTNTTRAVSAIQNLSHEFGPNYNL